MSLLRTRPRRIHRARSLGHGKGRATRCCRQELLDRSAEDVRSTIQENGLSRRTCDFMRMAAVARFRKLRVRIRFAQKTSRPSPWPFYAQRPSWRALSFTQPYFTKLAGTRVMPSTTCAWGPRGRPRRGTAAWSHRAARRSISRTSSACTRVRALSSRSTACEPPSRCFRSSRRADPSMPSSRCSIRPATSRFNRLGVALSQLRRSGLRTLLLFRDGGHLLDPDVPIVLERE